ncbi:MAG: hypothetical protein KAS72_06125 [Phycisphaerales bacterium]|nr:hypothetical protein [Phycisphaerales bacterium]
MFEVSPTTLVVLLLLGGLTALVPRHLVITPYFLAACLVPSTEVIIIAGFDFPPARVVVLVGLIRALLGEAAKRAKFVPLDALVLLWGANLAVMSMVRSPEMGMFVQQLGVLYEIYGMYFLARLTIQTRSQLYVALQTIAVCVIISVPLGIVEFVTHRRPAAILYHSIDAAAHLREDKTRVYGVFPQAIAFGNFMCISAALCWALWRSRVGMAAKVGLLGCAAAVICVMLSNSGTPLSTLGLTVIAIALFYYRPAVKWIVWGTLVFLTSYHLFYPGGKWWGFIVKASDIVGGSGFHRAQLIKEYWYHFSDWALIGASPDIVNTWSIGGDPANQWVTEGINGGLIGLLLFVAVIFVGFRTISRVMRLPLLRRDQALFWGIGCALFAFCASFIGLAQFGQINVLWFGVLGMIGSIAEGMQVTPRPPFGRDPKGSTIASTGDAHA